MPFVIDRLGPAGWQPLVILGTWEEAYQVAWRFSAGTGAWTPDDDGATGIPGWSWYAPALSIRHSPLSPEKVP